MPPGSRLVGPQTSVGGGAATAGRDGEGAQADTVVVVDAEVDVSVPSCWILTLSPTAQQHRIPADELLRANKTALGTGAGSLTTANACA